ncbi:cyclophane-forming radical SAM peptide maturase AmcB [Dactylosporangium sp. NPDC000244]|uniref:cyclophane-forming radical SAM peptide maturase AmcB n=1 Tax=Dactylosporangium sp. NPDC000244 TaxID=3154365 RepID=UPI00332CBFE0
MRVDTDRRVGRKFSMVVLQPTTRCSWNCDYCYLTTRDQRLEMTPGVADGVARGIEAQDRADPVTVVWHGGEPLSLRRERFERLLVPFEPLRAAGRVRHSVQTNAGLISTEWCELFSRHGFSIGVSVDGPEWANAHRRDAGGRPAFHRAMRGLDTLKRHGLRFTVIAVVTAETIGRADELVDFFNDLGADRVGFNIEEFEGANRREPVITRAAVEQFWASLFRRRAQGMEFRVREIERLLSYLRVARTGRMPSNRKYEPIPTVAWNGDTVLLSPELAGIQDEAYDNFVIGNVARELLPAMLAQAHDRRYVAEFESALSACAATCEFYDFCGGAQAGNRYFEHGTFDIAETTYCVNTQQALVTALHSTVSKESP